MKKIKNFDETVEKVMDLMQQYEYYCPSSNHDIYAYYDADTQTVDIMDYEYMGYSWINDDHIILYTWNYNYKDEWDDVDDPDTQLPEILDMDMDKIIQTVATNTEIDKDYIGYFSVWDIMDYIKDTDDWWQKLQDWRYDLFYYIYAAEFYEAAEKAVAEHFCAEEEED